VPTIGAGAPQWAAVTVHVGRQETVTDELQWHGARRRHVGFQEELDARAFGSPFTILFFSSA
jgi:hypothetical protein